MNAEFHLSARNIYSQYGEDGIIEAILERLPTDDWCVEFGAWDGVHLSNSNHLIRCKGYRSVMIEADPVRYQDLCRNHPREDCVKLNVFVEFEGPNTLDSLLARTPIPLNFDFLSIDIDGNDYHIFESLKAYRPKLICIEFNPTIPNEVAYVQERDFNLKRGCSALALCNLATAKGYALVAATHCNLLFVDESLLSALGMSRGLELFECRDDREFRVFLFSGYDGSLLTDQPLRLPWHNVELGEGALQYIPRPLRVYAGDYEEAHKRLFRLWLGSRQPKGLRRAVLQELRVPLGSLKRTLLGSLKKSLSRLRMLSGR